LKQCQNMVFLDLTQNTLPTWISEDMPRLVILRLKSNNFFGHIPIEITLFFLFVFLISQITPFLGLYHDLLRT
jgi:hypothetical protein